MRRFMIIVLAIALLVLLVAAAPAQGPSLGVIENPLVLGFVVMAITWMLRRLKWKADGTPALWLTMLVALVVAGLETIAKGLPNMIICQLTPSDPAAFLTCIWRIIEAIFKETGPIFALSQVIYQLLRREVAGKAILGPKI
jgi:di/tricarboxylate transporter